MKLSDENIETLLSTKLIENFFPNSNIKNEAKKSSNYIANVPNDLSGELSSME